MQDFFICLIVEDATSGLIHFRDIDDAPADLRFNLIVLKGKLRDCEVVVEGLCHGLGTLLSDRVSVEVDVSEGMIVAEGLSQGLGSLWPDRVLPEGKVSDAEIVTKGIGECLGALCPDRVSVEGKLVMPWFSRRAWARASAPSGLIEFPSR